MGGGPTKTLCPQCSTHSLKIPFTLRINGGILNKVTEYYFETNCNVDTCVHIKGQVYHGYGTFGVTDPVMSRVVPTVYL